MWLCVCETMGNPEESASSCQADCDRGFLGRATLLRELMISYNNDHVSGMGGAIDVQGVGRNGGSATAVGTAGRTETTTSFRSRTK